MSSRICPACGTQYAGWATRCADCSVALVDSGPSVLDLPDDDQLVYELGEWSTAWQRRGHAAIARPEDCGRRSRKTLVAETSVAVARLPMKVWVADFVASSMVSILRW